ncbi:UDP-N-acetylglucosamine 2-epimerase [Albibacterium sp.]|uniref:UDP-N-acetylglucosamine 2-epimerase n=1 Tax=Albibacterium sp. TaxID=2952885 RepID=UPI002CF5C52D|nr:UDP-N-acetylglucosamine 2-epimerase [Albibacterium sp.]HUH18005.1 UDP-N-acetylglucosamine 2-epimerase [Albibacterium sp.]
MKRIAIVTGTRAEYGLLKPLIELVHKDPELELQLLVTGAHLSFNHGKTVQQIEADGLPISKKIEILLSSDTSVAVCKSMGLAQLSFAEAFEELKPELVVILGDRYEMLAVASTALMFNIPIAHIHGGELTFGAIDDSIRHAITKMSNLHFAATEQYRKRIIQMGEVPDTVINTGAIGLDSIKNLKLYNRNDLDSAIGTRLKKKNFIITYHPETRNVTDVKHQIKELLRALEGFDKETLFLFTGANADMHGNEVNQIIKDFVSNHSENSLFFESLGQLRYLSCLAHFDLVIGNSSSGIIEAPSFKRPVINIGIRQSGRIMAPNIINCDVNRADISRAIKKGLSNSFKLSIREMQSPYGDGGAANRILSFIKTQDIGRIKKFHDLPFDV